MNREILFRGKSIHDKNYWIYGGAIHQTDYYGERVDRWFIVDGTETHDYDIGEPYEVDPATVGQWTGLTDKNGVKIFEGDIVSTKNNICEETYRFLVEFGVCGGVENVEHLVGFPCFFFKEVTGVIPYEYMMRKDPVYFLNAYKCEVIGNVYDNPELLNGGEK